MNRRSYAGVWSCPGPFPLFTYKARRGKACRVDNTRVRVARPVPATTAALDRGDRAPEWPFSRLRRKRQHAGAAQVQPDNVSRLVLKVGIVTRHLSIRPMRLQSGLC